MRGWEVREARCEERRRRVWWVWEGGRMYGERSLCTAGRGKLVGRGGADMAVVVVSGMGSVLGDAMFVAAWRSWGVTL